MEHTIKDENGGKVISFSGEVDLESSTAARQALLECVDTGQSVKVDLSGVSYIDSSGIASLVEALQSARSKGSDFALVSVSEAALRVLQLARLDKVFTILDSQ
jgi:anti-sigma B factor antagonist